MPIDKSQYRRGMYLEGGLYPADLPAAAKPPAPVASGQPFARKASSWTQLKAKLEHRSRIPLGAWPV
jgi:hypothetical protein